jgi:peptidoglycan/xylan/chitin deacetylase (PgdA/CDA1 family)
MIITAKRLAKCLLAHGVVRSGGWDFALRTWARRDATVVLTYHRVLEKWDPSLDYSQPGMVVTGRTLERHLSFLKRHFEIVPLGRLLDGHSVHRSADRPRCAITFDDGWRDNYELALPILHKHHVPATIFLTTDFIGTDRAFWHSRLIYVLLHGELSRLLEDTRTLAGYPAAVGDVLRRCARSGRATGPEDVDALIETVKATCDEEVIDELIVTLARAGGLSEPLFPERRFFLDWDQVREMAANGFEVGSHGCSHRIMTRLTVDEAGRELAQSKIEIERRLGREVQHFAFPNGDANATLTMLAARTGYRTACVGGAGDEAMGSGIRTLRRVGMHEGVGAGGPRHEDALLSLCLVRGVKSSPA